MTSLQSVADDVDSTNGGGDARVKINGRIRKVITDPQFVPDENAQFELLFVYLFIFARL